MMKYPGSRTLVRIIAIACCVGVLAGCSMVRLGYGKLDTIAAWRANEYFDLDARQKDEFLQRFRTLHEWHRYEQLPDYAAFLHRARARFDKPLTREALIWFVDGVKERYETIVERGAGDAAALLMTVTPAQLHALQRQWEKDNKNFAREHRLGGSAEDIMRARAQRMLEQARDWAGGLTPEQEQRIVAMARAMPMTEHLRYEDRLRRQREFMQLMGRRGDGREVFAAKLRQWLIDWDKGRAPEYERLAKAAFEQRVRMIMEIDRMLAPHQRTVALNRLENYIEDFTRLSARPPVRTAAQ